MQQEFNKLIIKVEAFSDKTDIGKLKKAWDFAQLAHTGQKRFSGEDYVSHPLQVAIILAEWKLDLDSIVAGLLHDTVEDGGAKREDLVKLFGEDVALLVDGVTHVTALRLGENKQERFIENLRKMVLFMAKDIRVVLVKLADRLHNMRTLWAVKKEKQVRIARETLEIYAPLAERLGMGKVKGELEDLAFQYCYPQDYKKVVIISKSQYKAAQPHLQKMRRVLLKSFAAEKIDAEVHGRQKHLYSLWKKLMRPEIDWDVDRIHDIVALRIIVDTIPQCYVVLGIVHAHFKPVPKLGMSDFIAQPKPNGYQSIHTKVFGPAGRVAEVQIRTHQMHQQAEHGVAAHWAYSQAKEHGISGKTLEAGVKVKSNNLSWVKQLVEWQKELTSSKEFLSAVKFDSFNHRNFVFSPKGDVFDLPAGATPVDFAYAVHTKLGRFIQGAKVNDRIVPLDHKLKSGDVIEILKSKNAHNPNRDWLDFVVTTLARREILKTLRQKN